MDAPSALDPRDLVAADLAQKLLAELSDPRYLARAQESLLGVVREISRTVHQLMNCMRPINRLPAEVLGRVRELYIEPDNPETEQPDASALLQLSLPALERCIINGCSVSPSTPIRLFPDSAALRVLQIARGGIHFAPSTNFPALTVLHLTKIAHVRLLDLLTFLSGTPCLQDLHLDLLSPMTLDATEWRTGRVQLRALERLVIHEETTETSGDEPSNTLAECRHGLLSSISVPRACALAVDGVMGVALISDLLYSLWPSPGRCATHVHLLVKHIPPRERSHRQRRQFVVHLSGEDGLDTSFGVVEHNDADADPSGDTARSHLASALSVGPVFRTTQKLLIATKLKWLRKDLRWIIAALPGIDSVIVHGKVEDHSSLLAFIKALEVASDATVPVPSLSTLVLNGGTCSIADPPDACGTRGEGAIFEMQRSRAAVGHPLQRLVFALGDISYEYDADGVLARVDAWSTVLQEFEEKWALEIEQTQGGEPAFDGKESTTCSGRSVPRTKLYSLELMLAVQASNRRAEK
ncbi:hypothetical protein TRAPUB_1314 [Trametes pubescens]|uniref:F-box domain-containing protein n=1 Tax=Trametes pubescens TaxID=154538 RepID=A0A1M2VJM8_TRAPU|nr:hypothetical protein TRAPUB_1314 [Trametes pubescens]